MNVADELTKFAQSEDDGHCFAGWPLDRLKTFFDYHARQGTLAFVRACNGGNVSSARPILAAAVGWQTNERELRKPNTCAAPFHWQATDPSGDSFLFCDLIVARAARRLPGIVRTLVASFIHKFPAWRELKLFAIRRGRLVQYPTTFLERL